jgi:hypothetical protein
VIVALYWGSVHPTGSGCCIGRTRLGRHWFPNGPAHTAPNQPRLCEIRTGLGEITDRRAAAWHVSPEAGVSWR